MLYLDFETYSELDVTDVGPHKYAEHPSTGILCLVYSINDGPLKIWHPFIGKDGVGKEVPKSLPKDLKAKITGHAWEAHNAMFEECIWNRVGVDKYAFPSINIENKNCSAAAGARLALPRALEKIGAVLKVKHQKDLDGKRLMLKLAKPRRPTKDDPHSKWHRKIDELKRVFEYCAGDVEAERDVSKDIPGLTPFEKDVWLLDQKINRKGVFIDQDLVDSALLLISEFEVKLKARAVDITKGYIQTLGQTKKIHEFLNRNQIFLPNLQAQTIADFLLEADQKYEPDHPGYELLKIRARLGSSSIKKYQAMKTRVCADGRVRDILVYHGASTGRFSGSGIQIQNLPRGSFKDQETLIKSAKTRDLEWFETLYDDPLKALSSCIRGAIAAPPGKVIRAFDWNAIEARTLFWLSRCELGLKEFRENLDIYKNQASDIFNVPADKINEEQRGLGKRVVLGAGYQMGPPKFVFTCKTQGNLVIPLSLAEKAIFAYRRRYKEVKQFWYDLNEAAIQTVLSGNQHRVGRLLFTKYKRFMTITLPSGRDLFYWYPQVKTIETEWGPRETFYAWYIDSQTKQWVEGPYYGGIFAENCASGVARDVMVWHMLRFDKRGHELIFSVHDEIVFEDDEKFSSVKEMEDCLNNQRPNWADGLPLKVSGWQDIRYKK